MDIASIKTNLARIKSLADTGRQALPFSIEIEQSPLDIMAWLANCRDNSKIYWAGRDGKLEIGGIGCGFVLSENQNRNVFSAINHISATLDDEGLLFLGGRRFGLDQPNNEFWKSFPNEFGFIPEKMIIRRNEDYFLRICLTVDSNTDTIDTVARVKRWLGYRPESENYRPREQQFYPVASKSYPDHRGWHDVIDQALAAIAAGPVEKVVLARRTDYNFEQQPDPITLLEVLKSINKRCYGMMYQPSSRAAFISFSPERLYRRRGRIIELDALSSTASRGDDDLQDRLLEEKLLTSAKERLEHRFVVDGVYASAADLCRDKIEIDETTVLKLERVQHLRTALSGNLHPDVDDGDIINRLHPTPAVGGQPKKEALALISRVETFDRGFYAAPIGYVSGREAEFSVGIRSLVVKGKTVSVFTGAGIVTGSKPDSEWNELDSKDVLRPLLAGSKAL